MRKELLERLAALGALAVSGGLVLVFVGFVFLTRPTGTGIDTTEAFVSWVSVGLVLLVLIAAHLYFARVLFAMAKGRRFGL